MKLTARDQKLLRWFYGALTAIGISAVIGRAITAYRETHSFAAIPVLVAGFCFLVVFLAALRNPKRPQKP